MPKNQRYTLLLILQESVLDAKLQDTSDELEEEQADDSTRPNSSSRSGDLMEILIDLEGCTQQLECLVDDDGSPEDVRLLGFSIFKYELFPLFVSVLDCVFRAYSSCVDINWLRISAIFQNWDHLLNQIFDHVSFWRTKCKHLHLYRIKPIKWFQIPIFIEFFGGRKGDIFFHNPRTLR